MSETTRLDPQAELNGNGDAGLARARVGQAWPGCKSESEKPGLAWPDAELEKEEPGLARTPSFDAAIAPLENGKRLDGRGLEECLFEFDKNPDGFRLVVDDIASRNDVRRPLGVLVWRIRKGEIPQPTVGPRPKPRTGWRLVRGTHGSTHVRDPEGTDRPPRDAT
jgi:hypothetical protein